MRIMPRSIQIPSVTQVSQNIAYPCCETITYHLVPCKQKNKEFLYPSNTLSTVEWWICCVKNHDLFSQIWYSRQLLGFILNPDCFIKRNVLLYEGSLPLQLMICGKEGTGAKHSISPLKYSHQACMGMQHCDQQWNDLERVSIKGFINPFD